MAMLVCIGICKTQLSGFGQCGFGAAVYISNHWHIVYQELAKPFSRTITT